MLNPTLVPGILFCNRSVESANPRLIDIGPTVLAMFGAAVPDYMDGKVLTISDVRKKASNAPKDALAEAV